MGFPSFCVLRKLHLASTCRCVAPSETRFSGDWGAVPSNKQGVFVRTKTLLAKMKKSVIKKTKKTYFFGKRN